MSGIFVCFFGITRSLRYTIGSIERNVTGPARALAPTRSYAHLYEQERAMGTRGREEGRLVRGEHQMLRLDRLELEAPGDCLETWGFERLKAHGDTWRNDFASMRNLVHQLHSLHRVTSMALEDGAEICVFCRPDLEYHDSLAPVLEAALAARARGEDRVWLPFWQPWGGRNDRFAVAAGRRAIVAYGRRVEAAERFCAERGRSLHSERLVAFALDGAGIEVETIHHRASRVRASGMRVWESFEDSEGSIRHERMKTHLWRLLGRSGLKPLARAGFRAFDRVRSNLYDRRNRQRY
jgi:hypothetical protein